jgi:hypothetical protein
MEGDRAECEGLSEVWPLAASDLGIDVVAPFVLGDDLDDSDPVGCIALVRGFGSVVGTAVVGRRSSNRAVELIADRAGVFLSFIDEDGYACYDRALVVETLNDWGWFGQPHQAPPWYTGRPWEGRADPAP